MKSILLSIKPKYVELIASGEKTIEVRKSTPKEVPFKCYIYCTYGNMKENYCLGMRGKVIGEFVCDKITKYPHEPYTDGEHFMPYGDLEKTCLDGWDLYDYLRVKDGYGWHISDLKIYDKPKELSDFIKPCPYNNYCCRCEFISRYDGVCTNFITRPPQSWCYVEELQEKEK